MSEANNLPVVFTTQTTYVLPSQKFMIPASWKRYQLSQLVNKALSLTKPIPFDFVVKGEILRSSLEEWCKAHNVGSEETLEIEYVESLMPPSHLSTIPHDDWVSAVSSQIPRHFVTGSYDGQIRLFNASQELAHSISAHSAPVTSLRGFQKSSADSSSDEYTIASSSHDGTARLTSLSLSSSPSSSKALASLHLHTAALSSIAVSSDCSHLLTGSWDGLVGVWDTTIPSTDQVPVPQAIDDRKKRRKVDDARSNGVAPRRKAPIGVLKGHSDRVMDVAFSSEGKHAFSCALDSSIRCWDVEKQISTGSVVASSKPFTSLLVPSYPNTLLASSTDRTVTIYDTRQLSDSSASTSYTTSTLLHQATPTTLAASPINAYHVASGGYDGVVRVWDLRSTKDAVAVASFKVPDMDAEGKVKRGDEKILSLDWSPSGLLAVGGEGGLDIWKVPE